MQSLPKLQELQERTAETAGRVNRLISAWPADDALPGEGYDSVKSTYKKLQAGLRDIQNIGQEDVKLVSVRFIRAQQVLISTWARAIDETLERIEILIAQRKASDAAPPGRMSK